MAENSFSSTMDFVNELNKSHGVTQRGGKKYTQVVHRMEAFRRFHGLDYGIDTNVLSSKLSLQMLTVCRLALVWQKRSEDKAM